MRIAIIDNYDSFTYNLVHMAEHITGHKVDVFRNDEITSNDLDPYDKIICSPGPGVPNEAGQLMTIIDQLGGKKSILGVCLGLQAIGEVYGCKLKNLTKVYHGIQSDVALLETKNGIFEGLASTIKVGRYHSWVIDKATLTSALIVTAVDDQGEIMGIKHREYPTYGVQFHPESIMTPEGSMMLSNFLNHL